MLREYRIKQKMSQDNLSEITRIDRKTIFRIENDINMPNLDNFVKLVVALKLTDEEIIQEIRKIQEKQKRN